MEIKWNGYNTFVIKGSKAKIVIDPTNAKEVSGDDIIITTSDKRFGFKPEDAKSVFNWPGEFEMKGVLIHNIAISMGEDEHRVSTMELEGIRFCNLGALTTELKDDTISELGNVDVLFVPLTLKTKYALELIEEIDPKLVILTMYNFEGCTEELPPVATLLKEVGQSALEPVEKIVIKSKTDLDSDNIAYAYLSL